MRLLQQGVVVLVALRAGDSLCNMSTDLRSATPRLRLMLKWAVDTAKIGAVCAESRCPPFTGARGVAAKIEPTGAVRGESLCPLHWS